MNKIEQNTIKLGGIDIDSVHIISPNTKRTKQLFGEDWKISFGMRVSITFDITDRDPQSMRVEITHEVIG